MKNALRFLPGGPAGPAALLLVLASPAAGQAVLVVDDLPGPGVDFTAIQPAVDAASEGDVILIQAGTYPSPVQPAVDGKSLSLVAEAGAVVVLPDGLEIRNLAPGQVVCLQGLVLGGPAAFLEPGLLVQFSEGHVRVQDCQLQGSAASDGFPFGFFPAHAGLWAVQAAECVLVRCELRGGNFVASGSGNGGSGAPGARVQSADVHAYGCTFEGGQGSTDFSSGAGAAGGPGVLVDGGFLFAEESLLQGAVQPGGCALPSPSAPGPGLALAGGGEAFFLDSVALPGALQPGCACCAAPAVVGAGLITLPGVGRSLVFPSPLREGEVGNLSVSGEPGDLAFLGFTDAPGSVFLPGLGGTFLLASPTPVLPLGAVPPGGALSLPLPIPELGPGLESFTWFLQLGVLAADGTTVVLGDPAHAVLLDGSL